MKKEHLTRVLAELPHELTRRTRTKIDVGLIKIPKDAKVDAVEPGSLCVLAGLESDPLLVNLRKAGRTADWARVGKLLHQHRRELSSVPLAEPPDVSAALREVDVYTEVSHAGIALVSGLPHRGSATVGLAVPHDNLEIDEASLQAAAYPRDAQGPSMAALVLARPAHRSPFEARVDELLPPLLRDIAGERPQAILGAIVAAVAAIFVSAAAVTGALYFFKKVNDGFADAQADQENLAGTQPETPDGRDGGSAARAVLEGLPLHAGIDALLQAREQLVRTGACR